MEKPCPECDTELKVIEPTSSYHIGTQYCEYCEITYTWKSPESTREVFWSQNIETIP